MDTTRPNCCSQQFLWTASFIFWIFLTAGTHLAILHEDKLLLMQISCKHWWHYMHYNSKIKMVLLYLVSIVFNIEVQMGPERDLMVMRQESSLLKMTNESPNWDVICKVFILNNVTSQGHNWWCAGFRRSANLHNKESFTAWLKLAACFKSQQQDFSSSRLFTQLYCTVKDCSIGKYVAKALPHGNVGSFGILFTQCYWYMHGLDFSPLS